MIMLLKSDYSESSASSLSEWVRTEGEPFEWRKAYDYAIGGNVIYVIPDGPSQIDLDGDLSDTDDEFGDNPLATIVYERVFKVRVFRPDRMNVTKFFPLYSEMLNYFRDELGWLE